MKMMKIAPRLKGVMAAGLLVLSPTILSQALAAEADKGQVASSLKPLHLIAQHIGGDGVDARLILPANQSVHHGALRPSQRQIIADSDIIFAIDPLLEASLAKLMAEMPEKWTLLSAPLAGDIRVRGEEGHDDHKDHDDHEGHDDHKDHDEHDEQETHEGHAHPDQDYHLFFSPSLMAEIGHVMADRLGEAYPQKAGYFAQNAAELSAILEAAQLRMAQMLAPTAPNHFIAMHDVTLYLEADLPIEAIGFLLTHDHSKPSAGQLRDLQKLVAKQGAACVFYEPQLNDKLVKQLTADMGLPVVTVDQLGSQLPDGADVAAYWRAIEAALKSCFNS